MPLVPQVGRDRGNQNDPQMLGRGDPAVVGPAILGAGTRLLTVSVVPPWTRTLARRVAWRDEVRRGWLRRAEFLLRITAEGTAAAATRARR